MPRHFDKDKSMGMLDWMWVGYYRVREYFGPGYIESQAEKNPADIFLVFSYPSLLDTIKASSVAKLAKAYYQNHKNFPNAIDSDPRLAIEFYLTSSRQWKNLFQLAQEYVEAAKQLWDSGMLVDKEKFTLVAFHHQNPCFAVEAADYCVSHCTDQKLLEAINSEALKLEAVAKNNPAAFDRIFQQPKLVQCLKDPDSLLSAHLKPGRRLLTKASPEKITQTALQNITFAKRILSHPTWLEKLSKPQILAIILKHRDDETFARELPALIAHHQGDFADIVVDPKSQAKQNLVHVQQIFTTPALYQSLGEERLAGIIKKLKSVSKYPLLQLSEMLVQFKAVIENRLCEEYTKEVLDSKADAVKKEALNEAYNIFFNEGYLQAKYDQKLADIKRIPIAQLQAEASYTVLKTKYRQFTTNYHPDKQNNVDAVEKKRREDIFKIVAEHYQLLEPVLVKQKEKNFQATIAALSPKKPQASPLKLTNGKELTASENKENDTPNRRSVYRKLSFSESSPLAKQSAQPLYTSTEDTPTLRF